jgi:hydrogenase-4 component E
MERILLIGFCLTILLISLTSRLEARVRYIALQGLLFTAMILWVYKTRDHGLTILLIIETLAVKTVAVPAILFAAIRKHNVTRESEPSLPNFIPLVLGVAVFLLSFLLASFAERASPSGHLLGFAVSLAAVAMGLVTVLIRKRILTHITGYILFENGIFLLSLVLGAHMPLIVSLGVLLDVFTGVLLLTVIYNHIKDAFDTVTIDHLSELKD